MFELIFLGTSASAPTIYRGLPAQMVLAGEYRFLIDCGEGTQRQILQSGLGFKRLNHILLTHAHLDHILGLGGLLSTLTRWEMLDEINIYGGAAALERVKGLLFSVVFPYHKTPIPLNLIRLHPGVIFEDKKFSITAFEVQHQGPDNFGFLFEEKSHRPFLVEKAEALGVPPGPERAQLVRGNPITLADGSTIYPDQVLGETIPGAKYVHIGDIGNLNNLHHIVNGADCLVMEATYADVEIEMAQQFGHMTAGNAARFAQNAAVKTLILTHLSRRNRESDLRREAQAIFPNTHIARDFDHFSIARGKPVLKIEEKLEPEPDITVDIP